MRDKGNTICDDACNNEACEFDLGDCGGDCKLPLPLPSYLELVPAATGLETGQSVRVRCLNLSERLKSTPELSEASLLCAESKSGTSVEAALEVQPVSVFINRVNYPIDDLAKVFECVPDHCPYIGVSGFSDDVSFFNGVYERAPSLDGRSHYRQNDKSFYLRNSKQYPFHLWMDSNASIISQAIIKNNIPKSSSLFVWRITPFDPYNRQPDGMRMMAAGSGIRCRLPTAGQPSNFTECLGDSSEWSVGAADSSKLNGVVRGVHVRCISKDQRKDLLTYVAPRSTENVGVYENGRPVTFITLPGQGQKKMFCEDQPEVQEMAKMSCGEIINSLGCDFLVIDAGKPVPDYLPRKTNFGMICPETCELCTESCSPGCPDWFLGNTHCDPACNNESCNFDNGDCVGQQGNTSSDIPFTFLILPDGEKKKVYCQDQPEVPKIANMTCPKIVDSLGCDFLLVDTGKPLPDYLPSRTTVGQICPYTCDLCFEECAVGCPKWFRRNLYCDPGCNNESCNFDDGDCIGIIPGSEKPVTDGIQTGVPTIIPSFTSTTVGEENCEDDSVVEELGDTCAVLKKAGEKIKGCESTLLEVTKAQNKQVVLPPGIPPTARVLDVCPKTCECCHCSRLGKEKKVDKEDECLDDPMVKTFGYTCKILEKVSKNLLNGCEAKLTEVAKAQGENLVLPRGIPPITRVLDACPVTCGSCDRERLRKPKPGQAERAEIVITLADGEFPNCVDDPRVEEAAGMTCRQVVYAVNNNCNYTLSNLSSHLPYGISPDMRLLEVCGYSCGKCPICEDQALVKETGGYSCDQVVEMVDYNCDILLKDLGNVPEGVPDLAALKHACPFSCGLCPGGKPILPPCNDHPQMEALGYNCELLLSFSMNQCGTKLSEMGIDLRLFPSDLGQDAVIGDACPATCRTCTAEGESTTTRPG